MAFREEHRPRVFRNRVLKMIFGPNGDDVTGEWRKLHNEKLQDSHSSSNKSIIRIIKLMIRWMGHVARMGEKMNVCRLWWESQRELDC
jgi:hypothetical protein